MKKITTTITAVILSLTLLSSIVAAASRVNPIWDICQGDPFCERGGN